MFYLRNSSISTSRGTDKFASSSAINLFVTSYSVASAITLIADIFLCMCANFDAYLSDGFYTRVSSSELAKL